MTKSSSSTVNKSVVLTFLMSTRMKSMLRDGIFKDGQKMSPIHITLKVGVISVDQTYNTIDLHTPYT